MNHLWEDNAGNFTLHMAASPTEDNTVRTKTATPDWYSWGIFRPFPRSHICRKKKKKKKKKEKKASKKGFQQSGSWLLSFLTQEPHLMEGNRPQPGSRGKALLSHPTHLHLSQSPCDMAPTTPFSRGQERHPRPLHTEASRLKRCNSPS